MYVHVHVHVGEAGVGGNEEADESHEFDVPNHKHYGSPCVYKAGWCVRQVMCIPALLISAISSKQPLSRDLWLVWPHHDSVFQCTCISIFMTNLHRSTGNE